MAQHAIILSTATGGGSTQYILTDVSKARLKNGMLGSQLAWGLDIVNEGQVEELFSAGTTETTGLAGMKSTVTLEWCGCQAPASHKRSDAAQLG
jgi:hypothetical protein